MKWIEQCPNEFKPAFYRRYVDDIFVSIEWAEHLLKFHAHLDTSHPNISFSFEQEINSKLSFLNAEVSRQQGRLVTTFYRKPTFSGVYTYFYSFLPTVYEVGTIYTLVVYKYKRRRCNFSTYGETDRYSKVTSGEQKRVQFVTIS